MLPTASVSPKALRHFASERNLAPALVDFDETLFAEQVEAVTAPAPLFRRIYQSAFHRIAMHVAQFLESFFRGPYVEIIEARLPEGAACFFAKQLPLPRVAALSFRQQRLRRALFHHLHYGGRTPHLGFGQQQVHMLRHDHVADDNEAVTLTCLFENLEETAFRFWAVEERQSSITGASDKVQVVSAVGAVKVGGHGKTMVSAASYPPSHKTRERGTHSFGMGKEKRSAKGWATRPR